MSSITKLILAGILSAGALSACAPRTAAGPSPGAPEAASALPPGALPSAIVSRAASRREDFDWGTLHTYYAGETYGTRDVLAAVAVIKPGREIHPPHEHAEEEYLMVTEGSGTWHLDGRDTPAQAGDMLYARPWDVHGIRNTGTTPLTFVVWKWNNKGVALPAPR